jgi:hypothetical protein
VNSRSLRNACPLLKRLHTKVSRFWIPLSINQGGYGRTSRATPGASLPSGSRTRNLQILDPAFKPLHCSGDTAEPRRRARVRPRYCYETAVAPDGCTARGGPGAAWSGLKSATRRRWRRTSPAAMEPGLRNTTGDARTRSLLRDGGVDSAGGAATCDCTGRCRPVASTVERIAGAMESATVLRRREAEGGRGTRPPVGR